MSWPVDEPKLARVRALMEDEDVDALVVRAPDAVLYLTDYWVMKGYDAAIFPREGEPVLVVMEPQFEEARATAWPGDVRAFPFYDPRDPRPPQVRSADVVRDVLRERGIERVALELSGGTQTVDRMVGEPTVPWLGWFQGFGPGPADASPLLAAARMIKTEQEIERMRLANTLASMGLEHVREHLREGMKESEVGALFEGHVHAVGVGFEQRVAMARAFTLVWSGPGIRTFTATGDRPVQAHEPTLLEIWVCADGYWTDLTKNLCPRPPTREYEELLELLLAVLGEAVDFLRPGASLAELDRLVRTRLTEGGYPDQPSHPICHGVGARAHEPPFAHQAGGGEVREGMVLALEPGVYWPEGGGLRLEDCYLIGPDGAEALCGFPDDFRETAWIAT
jgi:Xaa-Pro aminopeptidase